MAARATLRSLRRRKLLAACGLLLAAGALRARAQAKVRRIGFLLSETPAAEAFRADALRAGLRERGYAEGKNLAIEVRSADGKYDRLPALAAALVRANVEVLVAFGSKAAVAAHDATHMLPIVVPSMGDPLGRGLAASFARPGGNVTGSAGLTPELGEKRLELLKQTLPQLARVTVMLNPLTISRASAVEVYGPPAKALKLDLAFHETRSEQDIAPAFAAIAKAGGGAVLVVSETLFRTHGKEMADLAIRHKLASIGGGPEYADFGFLLSYGASQVELYHRGAYFVDRILKGAKPADLPIERASRIELAVNLRTAKALGLKVPDRVLARADRVIE